MITRLVTAVLLAAAPAVFAQTYIVPEGDCGEVKMHATTTGSFDKLGSTIDPYSVTRAYVYMPKQRVAVQPVAGAHSLDFTADVPDANLVIASVEFAPVTTGNETHTEHAKAMIRCGAFKNYGEWALDTRLGLELVPQWNGWMPLKPEEPMRFIAVDEGANRPVHDVPMELYRAGEGRIATAMPNDAGLVSFPFRDPGRYMVVMRYRRPDPKTEGHWLSDTTTLTFDLR